jgi:hypothetical protein
LCLTDPWDSVPMLSREGGNGFSNVESFIVHGLRPIAVDDTQDSIDI